MSWKDFMKGSPSKEDLTLEAMDKMIALCEALSDKQDEFVLAANDLNSRVSALENVAKENTLNDT